MAERKNISTGAPWEPIVGYSRAVRIGTVIEISGTVANDAEGKPTGLNDPHAQTLRILQIAESVLMQMGASMKDVIRTRIYVTDISRWEEVGKAHGQYFGEIRPATSMVEVKALIAPEYMVEIEFTAIVP